MTCQLRKIGRKVETNKCGRPYLVYWGSIANPKILGLRLGCCCYHSNANHIWTCSKVISLLHKASNKWEETQRERHIPL